MNKEKILLRIGVTIFVLFLSIGICSAEINGSGSEGKISKANTKALNAALSPATITGVYFGKRSNSDTSSSPWSMKIQDTTLNYNDVANTPGFAVLLINFANLNVGGNVKTDWYDNKNVLVYTSSLTIPHPGYNHYWIWYSVRFGNPSNLQPGHYHIKITTPWGTKTQDFDIVNTLSTKIYGIDISHYQYQNGVYIDLNKAKKEGVNFAIIKGMDGTNMDTSNKLRTNDPKYWTFPPLYNQARAAGLQLGAYQYTYAINEAQARKEAQLFITNCLQGRKFEYPIYIDVEDKSLQKLSKTQIDAIITAWCDEMQKAGYYPGFYANNDWFKTKMDGTTLMQKYTFWYARPDFQTTDYPMHQFAFGSQNVKVGGAPCDKDYCYVDFPSIIVNGGYNGY